MSQGSTQPKVLLYDADGNPLVVKGASTPAAAADPSLVVAVSPNSPLPCAIDDGGTLRRMIGDASGRQVIVGASSVPGTSLGGILSVQGVASGTPQPVSSAAASQVDGHSASLGATGDSAAANTVIGRLKALVASLPAALVGGRLDINLGSWLGSTAPTVGQKNMASSVPMVLSNDHSALWVAGSDDGTSRRTIKTLLDGTVQTRYKELPTFHVVATDVVLGNNKSMLSIANAGGSTVNLKILAIYLVNSATAGVTGVATLFELRRCVGHSATGTLISTADRADTTDAVQNASVTIRTGATITTESTNLIHRVEWSSDEWGPGTVDVEAQDHALQNLIPLFKMHSQEQKPLTLRAGEGLTVKCATNTVAGVFDVIVVFAQE